MRSSKYERLQDFDIDNCSDVNSVNQAVQHLIKCKEGLLEGGVVFSEYIELNKLREYKLANTNQSIYEEYRLWFFCGNLIIKTGYFEELKEYHEGLKDEELTPFLEIAKGVDSNFFAMDIVRKKDKSLMIIELNPGQTTGINYHYIHEFYEVLSKQKLPV